MKHETCLHPNLDVTVQAFVSVTVNATGLLSEASGDLGDSSEFFVAGHCPACGLTLSGGGEGTIVGSDAEVNGTYVSGESVERMRGVLLKAQEHVSKIRLSNVGTY